METDCLHIPKIWEADVAECPSITRRTAIRRCLKRSLWFSVLLAINLVESLHILWLHITLPLSIHSLSPLIISSIDTFIDVKTLNGTYILNFRHNYLISNLAIRNDSFENIDNLEAISSKEDYFSYYYHFSKQFTLKLSDILMKLKIIINKQSNSYYQFMMI